MINLSREKIYKILHEKQLNLIKEKKNSLNIQHIPDCKIVEGVESFHLASRFKHFQGYFVNINTNEILKLKKGIGHTQSIATDITKGGKKFNITREDFLPIVKKMGYESVLDYLRDKGNDYYDLTVLK